MTKTFTKLSGLKLDDSAGIQRVDRKTETPQSTFAFEGQFIQHSTSFSSQVFAHKDATT